MKRDSADWKAPKTDAVHARTEDNQLILQSMLRRCSSYSASPSCPDLSPAAAYRCVWLLRGPIPAITWRRGNNDAGKFTTPGVFQTRLAVQSHETR